MQTAILIIVMLTVMLWSYYKDRRSNNERLNVLAEKELRELRQVARVRAAVTSVNAAALDDTRSHRPVNVVDIREHQQRRTAAVTSLGKSVK